MTEHRDSTELAVEAAKIGAMLAGKGLTPEQVEKVMREQVQPVLDEAMQRAAAGEDITKLEFGLRYPAQS